MKTIELTIPQMGEGLEQVFIVQFLKEAGDFVKKDEPLYEMETDKATVTIESSYEGIVKEWLATKGTVLNVGAPIVRLEVEAVADAPAHVSGLKEAVPTHPVVSITPKLSVDELSSPSILVPPRTRTHCRKLGLSDEEILQIPAKGKTLMPEDVDAYLNKKRLSNA